MLDTQNSPLPHITETPNHILSTINATEKDVVGIWKSLYVNKSTGPDHISRWMEISVLPAYKENDKTSVNNYRPMSLLSCVSKVMECVVLNPRLIIFEIKVSYLLFNQGLLLATPLRTSCCTFITCYAKLSTTKKKLVFRDISKALIKDSKIQTSFIPQKYKYLYVHNYDGHLAKHVLEWQYNIIWRLSLRH